MGDETTNYGLLLEFDSDDERFVDGFELGRLWEKARHHSDPFTEQVHARNAEMVIRIAEATAREFSAKRVSEELVEVEFGGDHGD